MNEKLTFTQMYNLFRPPPPASVYFYIIYFHVFPDSNSFLTSSKWEMAVKTDSWKEGRTYIETDICSKASILMVVGLFFEL